MNEQPAPATVGEAKLNISFLVCSVLGCAVMIGLTTFLVLFVWNLVVHH